MDMTKKKNNDVLEWSKVITENWDRQREIDNTLSPTKGEIRYIVDYAKSILEKATRIDTVSNLAHEDVLSFEKGQQIIDWQVKQLIKDIKHLTIMLEAEDK